jgi:glycosyltransferase involved in cell wall biosynthesis
MPDSDGIAPMNQEPLRILHVNSLLRGGGTDDQCLKLAAGLHRLGQRIWLAGPEGREFAALIQESGVPFHATPPEGLLKLRLILDVARLIRRDCVQVVHGHHGRDLWPTILAARLSGACPKVVITRHMAKSPSSWFSRRFLLNRCDAMIAVSRFVAKVLLEGVYEPDSPELERRSRPPLRGDPSRVRVIYGGIDTDQFRPFDAGAQRKEWGLEPEHFAFAVIGSYDRPRGKGQREFLRAAQRIHGQNPLARFLIVGRGNLRDALESDIDELGLRGKALLAPYCRDMPVAMNAIDCLVHPQVGTEALGLVVCEAFACGKPVIASALDGIPEAFSIGNYGKLVSPEDVVALAQAMDEQAHEPRSSASEQNRLHGVIADRFSVPAMGAAVLGLYQELCGH